MAKKFPLLLVAVVVIGVVAALYFAGAFDELIGGPVPPSGGNTYDINVVPNSVTFVGGAPTVFVYGDRIEVSGSQAVMAAVTSVTMKIAVVHLTGSGARQFELTLDNPSYTSVGGGSYTLYDKDSQGCPSVTMSVDSGGTGAASCSGGKLMFRGGIDVSGGTVTISATFTMQEQLWAAGGGNPPVGLKIDGTVHGTGAQDYHLYYARSS